MKYNSEEKAKPNDKITNKVITGVSKGVIRMEFYEFFYFVLLFFCFNQFLLTIFSRQSTLFKVLQWFDTTNYLNVKNTIYSYFGFCSIIVITIILSFQGDSLLKSQSNTKEHYLIKILATLAFSFSYIFCLPLIHSMI